MKRFERKWHKLKETSLNTNEIRSFYKMLLKFEKRHPDFNAKIMMQKLYPTIDFDSL